MLILYPAEGLANRLRAIDSALRYCEKTGQRLSVHWRRDKRLCDCCWDDLFQPEKIVSSAGKGWERLQRVYKLKRHSRLFCRLLDALGALHIIRIFGPDDWSALRSFVERGGTCIWTVVESFSVFCWPEGEDFKKEFFRPSDEVQERLAYMTANFDSHTVGVHVRRTDNKDSLRLSPLESFTSKMRLHLAEDNAARFFVCSDDASVKSFLVREFGEEMISTPSGSLSRDSLDGMKQAAVELFALSRTSYIIGSYYSSFSEMASYLGGIKLEVAMKS